MAFMCDVCGAALQVSGEETLARCTYCGAVTELARQRQSIRGADAPGRSLVPLVLGVVGLSIAVAVVVAFAVGTPRPTVVSAAPTVSGILFTDGGVTLLGKSVAKSSRFWSTGTRTCGVDRNGDGVTDFFGLSGPPGNVHEPTLLDGATGKLLWSGARVPASSDVLCLSTRWVGVARPDFGIDFYDTRSTLAPVHVVARDKLSSYAIGEGCVAFETADGSKGAVTLPGGAATTCSTGPLAGPYDPTPGSLEMNAKSTVLVVGSRSYSLRKRERGTAILTVEASEGGRTLWTKEQPYAAPTFVSALAVGAGRVVLVAAEPADTQAALLVGLDADSGNPLYTQRLAGPATNNVTYFAFNGRYVVATYWAAIHAFDPRTGKQAWVMGD